MQGNLVLTVDVSPCRGNPDPPKRGEIAGFSKASRKRMIRDCARLGRAVPIFVTLTYGSEWPPDASQWKRDLDTWWKRCLRLQGDLSAIWRLEPQERGAPHFHLLIYQSTGKAPFLPHQWVADSWASVTSGDPSACSRVEALRSHRGGMFYAAKYCAKLGDGQVLEGWENVGKHWGKLNAKRLPFPPQHEMVLHSSMEQAAAIFTMSDSYKASFIARMAAEYEKAGEEQGAHFLAEKEWHRLRSENQFFGNTGTFFGTAEDFLCKLSSKMLEIEFHLAQGTGKPASAIRRDVDKLLAKA